MGKSKIYLIRHGQTCFNSENRLGGDSELTQKGLEHAEKVAEWLKDIRFKNIYCSTLKRSMNTAEILRKHHPETSTISKHELCEISAGDMDSMEYAKFKQEFKELFKARQDDKYSWCFPNGESYESALERVKPFLDEIKSRGETIALVCHQAINRVILGHLLDLPKTKIPYLVIPNDVVFIIDPETKEVSQIENGEIVQGYNVDKNSDKADVS